MSNVYSNLSLALKRVQSHETQVRNSVCSLLTDKTEKEIESSLQIIRKLP